MEELGLANLIKFIHSNIKTLNVSASGITANGVMCLAEGLKVVC